ncbi:MAG: FUN14 domain-containing protein [Acidilobaceae archaeon]
MSQEITGGDVFLSLLYQGGGGFALGFAAGYFAKRAVRVFVFLAGAVAVLLLLLAYSGIITVNWDKLALLVERALFNAQAISASLQSWLLASLPFGGAFLAGAAIGFKYG